MGSRARLRTLAEGVDVIILIWKRWRSGRYSIHTSGGGGLPDLISFSSKFARIGGLLVRGQGETHESLLPLEGVEGVKLEEAFL